MISNSECLKARTSTITNRRCKDVRGDLGLTNQNGFSLLELMVVVAIVAILSMVAAPNMSVFVENSQVRSTANDFSGALALARSEALVQNGLELRARVDSGVASFDNGWCIVPIRTPRLTCENGGDDIVRIYNSVGSVGFTSAVTAIEFNGRGALVGDAVSLTIEHSKCSSDDQAMRARTVVIGRTGRATVEKTNCE